MGFNDFIRERRYVNNVSPAKRRTRDSNGSHSQFVCVQREGAPRSIFSCLGTSVLNVATLTPEATVKSKRDVTSARHVARGGSV
jgi:hypothetical protein